MSCYRYKKDISLFIDDMLDNKRREKLLVHFDKCCKCSLHYADLMSAIEEVHMLPPVEVPQSLRLIRRAVLDGNVKRRGGFAYSKLTFGLAAVCVPLLALTIWVSLPELYALPKSAAYGAADTGAPEVRSMPAAEIPATFEAEQTPPEAEAYTHNTTNATANNVADAQTNNSATAENTQSNYAPPNDVANATTTDTAQEIAAADDTPVDIPAATDIPLEDEALEVAKASAETFDGAVYDDGTSQEEDIRQVTFYVNDVNAASEIITQMLQLEQGEDAVITYITIELDFVDINRIATLLSESDLLIKYESDLTGVAMTRLIITEL